MAVLITFDRYYSILLTSINSEFRAQFQQYDYVLSALLSASYDTIDTGYDVKEISDIVDFMNMNTYDFNGFWSDDIQPNAPLYSNDRWNVDYAISYMLKLGAEPSKLILGIPLYGRVFIDTNLKPNIAIKLGDAFNSTEEARKTFLGPYTQDESGVVSYGEICLELLKSGRWTRTWDELSKTPFITHNNILITYDDRKSIAYKVQYAIDAKLGGIAASSLDLDDFLGDCAEGNKNYDGFKDYLLLRSIRKELDRYLEETSRIDNHSNRVNITNNADLFNSHIYWFLISYFMMLVFF